jgi:hypothetical protein
MSLFWLLRRSSATPRSAPARPGFEALEDRQVPSTISGYVFNDTVPNGLFGAGDQGINGNTLLLYKGSTAAGTPIAAATSGANGTDGFYQFTTDSSINQTPTPITYNVTLASKTTNWTQAAQLPQFDPSLGALQSIQIVSSGTLQTDFGLQSFDGEAATITASVRANLRLTLPGVAPGFSLTTPLTLADSFNAAAYDPANYPSSSNYFGGPSGHDSGIEAQTGSQSVSITNNPGDPNFALFQALQGTGSLSFSAHAGVASTVNGPGNVLSNINSSMGGQIQVTYTYIPSNALKPGTYTIVQTTTPPGYLPGLKSSGGVVIPNSTHTNSITVTLTAGASSGNNFAEVKPAAVSGFIYVDSNNNGVMDSNEPGIAGVTLRLTGSNDLGAIVPLSTVTGADGSYSFGHLRPGTYTVTETTQPAGYLSGAKSQGQVVVAGSTAPDSFTNLTVSPGGSSANNNIGKVRASSLSGHVYLDLTKTTRAGFGGIVITLTGSNDLGTITPLRVVTAADGSYRFGTLRPGSYTITETPPGGKYVHGKSTLGTVNGATAGSILSNTAFLVAVGQSQAGVNYDFHELLPPTTPQVTPPVAPRPPLSKVLFLSSTIGGGR